MLGCNTRNKPREKSRRLLVCFTFLFSLSFLSGLAWAQEKGGRETGPAKAPSKRVTKPSNRPTPKPKLANIVLSIDPSDSVLVIDDQPSDKVDALGTARLTDLKPGTHSIIVRKSGYREKQQSIDLKAGDNEPLGIRLEILKGSLTVSPNIDGAEISLRKVDTNQGVGTYSGGVTQIEFPPGEYELSVSRKGYKPVTRRFTIKPGESAYLEPHLEALPKPRPQVAMTASVRTDGKYFVVQLFGSSGSDLPRSGSINVSVIKGSTSADVSGNFTGLPCDIELVRLENVSDASLIEYPGSTNQWARAVIRVRAKDTKKPARFAINFRVRESSQP